MTTKQAERTPIQRLVRLKNKYEGCTYRNPAAARTAKGQLRLILNELNRRGYLPGPSK